MSSKYIAIIFIYLPAYLAMGQCPIADFAIANSDKLCANSAVILTNNSTNGVGYQWDFCPEDFTEVFGNSSAVATGAAVGHGYKLIEDNGSWYGFMTLRTADKLIRLDYGASPESIPTVVDLGSFGLIDAPEGIAFHKEGNNWFAFIGKGENGVGQIVRLAFGNDLSSIPTATGFGTFGLGSIRIRDVNIVQQGSDLVLLLLLYNSNSISRINFGSSLSNVPLAPSTLAITGSSLPRGFSVVRTCSEWIIHVVSENGLVQQVTFGANILGPLTVSAGYTFTSVIQPWRIKTIYSGGNYYSIISNNNRAYSIINFGDLTLANPPTQLINTNDIRFTGLDVVKYQGGIKIQGFATANSVSSVNYAKSCGLESNFSLLENPDGLRLESGAYKIDLGVTDQYGRNDFKTLNFVVSNNTAPDITIGFDSNCTDAEVNFSLQSSSNLISWDWDLGNSTSSNLETPVELYVTPGSFEIVVDVEDVTGCVNQASQTLNIYPPPSASFTLPTGLICTNNEFTFANNTVDNFDGNLSFQWLLDDVPVSTDEDLLLTFNSGGDKEITLQASIPGCSSESVQIVTGVGEGPSVDFTLAGNCLNESTLLTNNSQGAIAGYSWDFGDGQTSTEINPTVNYTAAGNYTVELETLGSNGCISKKSLPLQIFSVPQPNFNIDLPPFSCNGTPTQFNDLTPSLTDSNLGTWEWDFNDQNASASIQHPQYTYALSGDYNVSLTVTSDQGCGATTNKTITIAQSPQPVIVNTPACVETAVVLQDGAATSASTWQWQVDNNFYFTESPSHVFATPGDYEISLTLTASNGCVGTTTKQVAVPLPLTVNFESAFNCANTAAQFTAVVNDVADPVTNYSWFFGDVTRSGATVNYLYNAPGTEEVQLIATTQNGCAYTTTKAITILPAPVADFSFTPGSGAPPLAVTFTNQSVNANSFLWKFNDAANNTSNLQSPAFTFTDFGEYAVDLTAKNSAGCESTVSKLIAVAFPRINVTLDNFRIISNTDGSFLLLTNILNNGNVLVQNPKIEIRLDNAATLQEVLNTNIGPGASVDYTLSTLVGANNNLNYACIRLVLPNNEAQENTEACITFEANTAITSPYPNPANELVTVEWISPIEESVSVIVNDYLGNVMATESISSQQGLNTLKLQTLDWQAGIYFIRIKSNSHEHFFRTIIAR